MNYYTSTEEILGKETNTLNKVIALCNLLIPKIMYISKIEAEQIQPKLKYFQSTCEATNDYYILHVLIAFFEYKKSNYENAIDMMTVINEVTEVEDMYRVSSYTVIGASCRSLGKKELALNHFQKTIETFHEQPLEQYQKYFLGLSLYHVAELCGELKEYDAMLEKHLLFYEYGEKWKNIDVENRALNGIGRAYQGRKEYNLALEYLKKGEENSKTSANIPFIARNNNDIGKVYTEVGKYEAALEYYHKALDLRKKNNLTNATVTTLLGISKTLSLQKEHNKAIEVLQEALAIAKPLKVNRKIYQIYELLSIAYEASEQHKESLIFYRKYHLLKEEVDNVDKTQVENQKIREANTELKQQKALIESQNREIESNISKLKETTKYLENFASVAAHDLKAPIRIAANFAQLLKRRHKNIWDKNDLEYFDFITNNITLLVKMVDDLLSLSKLDQNLPPVQRIEMSRTIREVVARLREKIERTNACVSIEGELPELIGHSSLITQLFQNIIDNAIKHSESNQVPDIKVYWQKLDKNPEFCQFEIKDNGSGIPQKDQPYIFELFNGSDRSDSTGIGLAICKKIVHHYGGNIWVKSELNEGTSIFFTLPLLN